MSEKISIHCYVSGRVQGVWFRASTKTEAEALGLTGWVRNLADGRVEVIACGEKESVNKLRDWLQHGPQLAEVTDLKCEVIPRQEFEDFKAL